MDWDVLIYLLKKKAPTVYRHMVLYEYRLDTLLTTLYFFIGLLINFYELGERVRRLSWCFDGVVHLCLQTVINNT